MNPLAAQSALAFLAGMVLNFMPCVLPVMPIKIRALLRETPGTACSRTLAAAALLAGSLTFFIVLGVVTAGFGLMWGQQFQLAWFRLLLALVLVAAAIVTFAGWSWRLPQMVYRVPMSHQLGAFLTGALAGILSTPCSGPFLGSVLAFAATRSTPEIMVLFSAIGAGMAFPYLVLMTWPGLLSRLSFDSRLAANVKTLLGFVLLSGSLFFVQGFLSPLLGQAAWMALVLGVGSWLVIAFTDRVRSKLRLVLILALATLVVTGFHGPASIDRDDGIPWQAFSDQRLHEAAGRPVLVTFTADWCINCQALKQTAFKDKRLLATLDRLRVMPLEVNLTQVDDVRRKIFARFDGRAIPFIVVLDGRGQIIQRYTGMVRAQTLIEVLQTIHG